MVYQNSYRQNMTQPKQSNKIGQFICYSNNNPIDCKMGNIRYVVVLLCLLLYKPSDNRTFVLRIYGVIKIVFKFFYVNRAHDQFQIKSY